jgi:hypothetical protein
MQEIIIFILLLDFLSRGNGLIPTFRMRKILSACSGRVAVSQSILLELLDA